MIEFLTEQKFESFKLSIQTLLGKNRCIVRDKYETAYRHKSKKLSIFGSVQIDAKNQLTENRIESFSLNLRLLIVTLKKEIKPVVTEKHDFDNRG